VIQGISTTRVRISEGDKKRLLEYGTLSTTIREALEQLYHDAKKVSAAHHKAREAPV
jgi:hypothetical protein